MRSRRLRSLLVCVMLIGIIGPVSRVLAQSSAAQRAQRQAIRGLENALKVRGDGDGSAKWYVLALSDQAQRISTRFSGSTTTHDFYDVLGESRGVQNVLIVQGRRQAAEAILRYLLAANWALDKMPALSLPNWYCFGKFWDFRAFATQAEARAFYETLTLAGTKHSFGG